MELLIASIVTTGRARREMGDISPLIDSIRKRGCLHPPVVRLVDARHVLVAGGRRLVAMSALGMERVTVTVITTLADELAALCAEHEENTCREPLLPTEAAALAERIKELVAAQAKDRQREAGRRHGIGQTESVAMTEARAEAPADAPVSGRTAAHVAKVTGYGKDRLAQAQAVVKATADPDPKVRRVAKAAASAMDATRNVSAAHRAVREVQDWDWGSARFPWMAVVPEHLRHFTLEGARSIAALTGQAAIDREATLRRRVEARMAVQGEHNLHGTPAPMFVDERAVKPPQPPVDSPEDEQLVATLEAGPAFLAAVVGLRDHPRRNLILDELTYPARRAVLEVEQRMSRSEAEEG